MMCETLTTLQNVKRKKDIVLASNFSSVGVATCLKVEGKFSSFMV